MNAAASVRRIERAALLAALREPRPWDVLVLGGGATGLGIAVDAAARGLRTALIEARDFASGTSSRSTKLIHGGVRYLAQGNVKLVREALAERALLIANAPGLVHPMEFIVPCYRPLEREVMRVGLGIYDALAGSRGIGPTRWLTRAETIRRLPTVRTAGLHGGVSYWDAQFDDARLAIALMRTACRLGATAINYVGVETIEVAEGRVAAVAATDAETGERFRLRARVIFNATGVWVDRLRTLADASARPIVAVSRGSHIVVGSKFLPGERALMIPKTSDGRVLFAIPWMGSLVVGTTDVPICEVEWEPQPSAAEVDFIIETARGYLRDPIRIDDITGTFAGLRPLLAKGVRGATKTLSREHSIVVEHGNFITVTGGKWTTYRRMAVDALAQATRRGLIPDGQSTTDSLRIDLDPVLEAARKSAQEGALPTALRYYADLARDCEQARSVSDLLDRRLRIGLTNRARAAQAAGALG
ncbi:MAG TPA: glycerol-3-phosphate dehydrogenase/oxidase [Burkholderiaceae bacterium]|nr:glycerol-3-phosphate dehydrogenase/oxidase [Burkholderiaceae bacterium]